MILIHGRLLASGIVIALGLGFAATVAAQSVVGTTQRDVNQQKRIDQGLKSGQLSAAETARLERGAAHIDRMQQRDMRDGSLSTNEAARLRTAQNRESRAIQAGKHNVVVANPESRSSRRMQRHVARDLHQQARIRNGEKSGALTTREAGRLEGRAAHADHVQYRAARDGHVGPLEQRHLRRIDKRNSRQIFRLKHNGRRVG
ncbi:MAG TPA: hypothetical protein VIL60_01525 [Rhodanobacter sp.]